MADCKNCLHWEACADVMEKDLFIKEKMLRIANPICKCFLDKSKVIELPCKVGDIVYHYCSDFSTILPYFVENLNVAFLGNKDEQLVYTFEANCNNENEDELLDSIDFELKDIGKTVFLTREEAERALEEDENK